MKRMTNYISFFLCSIFLLTGCQKAQRKPSISMVRLQEQIVNSGQDFPQMETVTSKDADAKEMFSYLADFPYDKVESYFFLYSTDSSRAAYEIAVVCLKSESDLPQLEQAIKEHVDYRVRTFETYAPDQVVLMEQASLVTRDQYLAFFVTEQNQELVTIFNQAN